MEVAQFGLVGRRHMVEFENSFSRNRFQARQRGITGRDAPNPAPLRREAVEKGHPMINGGAKLRYRGPFSFSVPFFIWIVPCGGEKNQSSKDSTGFLHNLASC